MEAKPTCGNIWQVTRSHVTVTDSASVLDAGLFNVYV